MTAAFLIVLGLALLVIGAESFVRGASQLAALIGIPPLIIGLTVVAFGTSSPELAVSIQSALTDQASLALGNVVGSNIFNILFVLGSSAAIAPLLVSQQLVRLDVPVMIGVSILMYLLSLDGRLSTLDGVILFSGAIVYTVILLRQGRSDNLDELEEFLGPVPAAIHASPATLKEPETIATPASLSPDPEFADLNVSRSDPTEPASHNPEPSEQRDLDPKDSHSLDPEIQHPAQAARSPKGKRLLHHIGFLLGGLALLTLGSRWLVEGCVQVAEALGVSELVIGLTVVAMGTSLPEAATSVVASLRGERDIAVGNVVGSNIFNILAVLGVCSIIAPHGIEIPNTALYLDIPAMIAVAIACLPIFFTGNCISRWEGIVFLTYQGLYTTFLILKSTQHASLPIFNTAVLIFVIPLTVLTLGIVTIRYIQTEIRIRQLLLQMLRQLLEWIHPNR